MTVRRTAFPSIRSSGPRRSSLQPIAAARRARGRDRLRQDRGRAAAFQAAVRGRACRRALLRTSDAQLGKPDSKSCRSLDEAPLPGQRAGHVWCWLFQAMCGPTTSMATSSPASRCSGKTIQTRSSDNDAGQPNIRSAIWPDRSPSARSTKLYLAASKYRMLISVPARSSVTCSSWTRCTRATPT